MMSIERLEGEWQPGSNRCKSLPHDHPMCGPGGYGIRPGPNRECQIVEFASLWAEPTVLATIPDASPLQPGDLLRIDCDGDAMTVRFFVNHLCVWTHVHVPAPQPEWLTGRWSVPDAPSSSADGDHPWTVTDTWKESPDA